MFRNICKFVYGNADYQYTRKEKHISKTNAKDMGVIIQQITKTSASDYKQKLAKVSVWGADDFKVLEESSKAFENLKPQQW